MGTISDKLAHLSATKDAIKQAIIDKGGSPGDVFGDYPQAIMSLSTSGDTSDKTIVAFTDVGPFTWDVPEGVTNVDVLVVAGGGAGGWRGGNDTGGGGGGAGGIIYEKNFSVAGTVSGSVGAGGTIVSESNGLNGEDSTFSSLVAFGGGGGARFDSNGNDGGSGGGAAGRVGNSDGGSGGASFGSQGNSGGSRQYIPTDSSEYGGGAGGGGASSTGGDIVASGAGLGGTGLYIQEFDSYGVLGWFSGGGAGGLYPGVPLAAGGTGGGGASHTSGINGTGGGGGGGGKDAEPPPGNGGSGVVLIRY